ncbi:hypothetical protein ACIRRA_42945 [Nocardia sp. NPDC101769]|uniref:hypothetical protein n=1 Tax=Nocardia sp. NPDC101769 TaxID=3364333 RepID=UPI00382C3248
MEALVAHWEDRPKLAAELAADGWRFKPETGTARIRLACIEARARACTLEGSLPLEALARADRARETMAHDDDLGGMFAFPVSKQLLYVSSTRLWLGSSSNLAAAASSAADAIRLYDADSPETRRVGEKALAQVDLALARLGCSDLDGAADAIDSVLEAGGARRTESIARRLRHVHAALERPALSTSSTATSLRERLSASPIKPTPASTLTMWR